MTNIKTLHCLKTLRYSYRKLDYHRCNIYLKKSGIVAFIKSVLVWEQILLRIRKNQNFFWTTSNIWLIPVVSDFLPAKILSLLRLDALDTHCVVADKVMNRLIERTVVSRSGRKKIFIIDDWEVPMEKVNNHAPDCVVHQVATNCSRAQLEELHR